jgi:hypothetical protein
MWETIYMKVITIEAGTTIFIMVRDGDLFTHGTTHGIMVVITVVGMTHGIQDMVVGTEAGADGIVHGFTAAGILLGTTVMEDTMVTAEGMVMVMVTVADMAMASMMDIIAA